MESFLICFIPLFVAMDPLGAVPIYLGITEGMTSSQARRVIWQTVVTALIFALAFLFLGKGIFVFLGISINDFKIAGGIILLLVALDMVLRGREREHHWDHHSVGVVPLGVPLIAGPATITTMLIQIDSQPLYSVVAGLGANIVIVIVAFIYSRLIAKAMGLSGMTAMSKIIGLFLVAIAVMMIRVGIQGAFGI